MADETALVKAGDGGVPVVVGNVETGLDISNKGQLDALAYFSKMIASSSIIPEHFRGKPNDCFILAYRAKRTGDDVFELMAHTHVHKGRIGYDGMYFIAKVNTSGKLAGPLSFDFGVDGEVTHNGKKYPNKTCTAYGTLAQWNREVRGPTVSLRTAIDNGWTNGPTGAQWFSLTELRLQYRAGTYFARTYCPEVIMGMEPIDEIQDVVEADSEPKAQLFGTKPAEQVQAEAQAAAQKIEEAVVVETVQEPTDAASIPSDAQREVPIATVQAPSAPEQSAQVEADFGPAPDDSMPDRPDPAWSVAEKREWLMKHFEQEATKIEGFLCVKRFLKEGEGLPSLKDSNVNYLVEKWEQFAKSYEGYKAAGK